MSSNNIDDLLNNIKAEPINIDGIESNTAAQEDPQEKKNAAELADLLEKVDEWKPIIPDEVMDFYLERAGFQTGDIRVKRLITLATQRFVSNVASDACQFSKTRTGSRKEGSGKGKSRSVLTIEDLSSALKEYGVDVERGVYSL